MVRRWKTKSAAAAVYFRQSTHTHTPHSHVSSVALIRSLRNHISRGIIRLNTYNIKTFPPSFQYRCVLDRGNENGNGGVEGRTCHRERCSALRIIMSNDDIAPMYQQRQFILPSCEGWERIRNHPITELLLFFDYTFIRSNSEFSMGHAIFWRVRELFFL